MSENDSSIRRWSFGPIAPGQAPVGLFMLIGCTAVGLFSLHLAVSGVIESSSAPSAPTGEESPDVVQDVVIPAVGALFVLVGGGFLSLVFLRAGLEEESLMIDERSITIEHTILSRKRRKEYLRQYISELRVAEGVPEKIPEDEKGGFNPVNGGSLVFQYGGQSVYFGPQVILAEAQELLGQILDHAPDLAQIKAPVDKEQDDFSPNIVSPVTARYSLRSNNNSIHVIIPARSSRYTQLFMLIWLILWNVGIALAAWHLWHTAAKFRTHGIPPDDPEGLRMAVAFLSLWLAVAVPASLYITFAWVWGRWGRQIIEIDASHIRIRNRCPVWRSTRTINRARTSPIALREPKGYFAKVQYLSQRGDSWMRGGWLECKEGYKKHVFGAGLTRRETIHLLHQLHGFDSSLVTLPASHEPRP